MTHRIREVKALENFVVSVIFQEGIEKEYDLKELFPEYPQFLQLKDNKDFFEQVQVDVGGYGISWDDKLDLSAEELWDNGKLTDKVYEPDIADLVGVNLIKARATVGMTQKELSEKVNIYQADISKIERGLANPSVQTLKRLADGMGMKVKIEFVQK